MSHYSPNEYQIVKETKIYPWPCESEPNRTIQVFAGKDPDILTRVKPGIFNMRTGIFKMHILIPEKDIIEIKENTIITF